jgi:hypothetical protein
MSQISKGKEILDSLPRIESDPKEDLMKLKRIHEEMRKHKEKVKIRKKKLSMDKEKQRRALIEMMQNDEELGLYDLSSEDIKLILKTCENSPEPNEALKQAIKRYKDGRSNC